MAEAVVVGVRVRPFNQREKELNAVLCIEMNGQMTTISDKAGTPYNFSFDQSFWSHDGFEDDGTGYMRPLPGSKYSDQRYVYDSFGQRVLDNAWTGYHCCLFAYGQTGAGKSYSMVGYGNNKGIVPISCDEIFLRVQSNTDANRRYEIMVSMLEIYNETVQDLFVAIDQRPKQGLQIRESKALGIYVEGIMRNAVSSYKEIEEAIEYGTSNRSIASTAMNATSSRAHTVITIEFKQVEQIMGKDAVKLSMINLVDLAGSEKANQTGAKGDRLKEGSAINKSLSALGNVIEKLAEKSQNKGKNVVVPYRDSKLTRLLQNALGGSSKTIMICALSPASSNFEETLSTLRYADRAKKIKNMVVINENPQEKLMREMREENEKLKAILEAAGGGGGLSAGGADSHVLREQQEHISRLEQQLEDQLRSFQEKVDDTRKRGLSMQRRTLAAKSGQPPMIVNLNPVESFSCTVRFPFKENSTMWIGGAGPSLKEIQSDDDETDSDEDSDNDSDEEPDIMIGGNMGVYSRHACVENVDGRCFIRAHHGGKQAAQHTWVNGKSLDEVMHRPWMRKDEGWELKEGGEEVCHRGEDYREGDPPGLLLKHGDRLVFGKAIWLFVDPRLQIPEIMVMSGKFTYARAKKELPATQWKTAAVVKRGFTMTDDGEGSDSGNEEKVNELTEEVAVLKRRLLDADTALQNSVEGAAKDKREKDDLLRRLNNATATAHRAIQEKRKVEEQIEQSERQRALLDGFGPVNEARLRLDLAIMRIRSAMNVARSAGVCATEVAAAEAKLDLLNANIGVTEKIAAALKITDNNATLQVKLALQQTRLVTGMPIEKRLIAKAEGRLAALQAASG